MPRWDFELEGRVYDLVASGKAEQVTDVDRLISKAVYESKQHLGPRGMIEVALAIARQLNSPTPDKP